VGCQKTLAGDRLGGGGSPGMARKRHARDRDRGGRPRLWHPGKGPRDLAAIGRGTSRTIRGCDNFGSTCSSFF